MLCQGSLTPEQVLLLLERVPIGRILTVASLHQKMAFASLTSLPSDFKVRQVDSLAQKDDPLVLGAFDQFRQTQDVEFFLRRVLLILRCS